MRRVKKGKGGNYATFIVNKFTNKWCDGKLVKALRIEKRWGRCTKCNPYTSKQRKYEKL